MAVTFDGLSKRIVASSGTVALSVRDLYSRWKEWVLVGDNAKFLPAFSVVGGDDIDPIEGTAIPTYAFLLNGWRVRPQEASHTLSVSDGILLVAGGGDPFVNPLGTFAVRINYQQPVQAISFASDGGGGATPEQIADAVWLHSAAAGLQGSVGELLGLAGKNQVIDQVEPDESGAIASARLRTFPTPEDAEAGTNAGGSYQLLLSRSAGLLSMVRMTAS